VLALKEKLLGPSHPDTAMTLNNLAVLLKAQGELNESALFYQRALAVFQSVLKSDHPKLIRCRKNYASLLKVLAMRETPC
jgi:hypothetical protein